MVNRIANGGQLWTHDIMVTHVAPYLPRSSIVTGVVFQKVYNEWHIILVPEPQGNFVAILTLRLDVSSAWHRFPLLTPLIP